jgi:hypothetical protein
MSKLNKRTPRLRYYTAAFVFILVATMLFILKTNSCIDHTLLSITPCLFGVHNRSLTDAMREQLEAILHMQSPANMAPPPEEAERCTQKERLQLLRAQCKLLPKTNISTKFFRNIFIDEKHKLVACLPPKSGCTTWKAILANNSGPQPLPADYPVLQLHGESPLHEFNIVKFPELRNQSLRDKVLYGEEYTRVIVARHPLDRVYSAYRNKLLSGKDRTMQKMHGNRILSHFHPELDRRARSEGKGVTFSEFIKYIQLPMSKPSAWAHWDSVYDICQPCHVPYDYVLKTETLDADNALVIRQHLGPYHRGLGTAGNVIGGKNKHAALTRQGKVLDAYSTINASDFQYLEKRFHNDFKLFGYTWTRQNNKNRTLSAYCRHGGEDRMCC